MGSSENDNGSNGHAEHGGGFIIEPVVPEQTLPLLKNLEVGGDDWMKVIEEQLAAPGLPTGPIARAKRGAMRRVDRFRSND